MRWEEGEPRIATILTVISRYFGKIFSHKGTRSVITAVNSGNSGEEWLLLGNVFANAATASLGLSHILNFSKGMMTFDVKSLVWKAVSP